MKNERLTEIMEMLYDGVRNVFASDNFLAYLKFMSGFRQYSARNCVLIRQQRPNASYVASYSDWRTKFHRRVRKGEKAIRIIAPHEIKSEDGKEVVRIGFHTAPIFDISQTDPDGDTAAEVPRIARRCDVPLDSQHLPRLLAEALSPVPVRYGRFDDPTCNGMFVQENQEIIISEEIRGTEQEVSTILHEVAHSWLHCEGGLEEQADRHTREIQAQGIAYVVSEYLGIDTACYSFVYVATWSKSRTPQELAGCLDVIRRTSMDMIERIEEYLQIAV